MNTKILDAVHYKSRQLVWLFESDNNAEFFSEPLIFGLVFFLKCMLYSI